MKVVIVPGLGPQIHYSEEQIQREVRRLFSHVTGYDLSVAQDPMPATFNGLREAVTTHVLIGEDALLLSGPMYQSVMKDYLARRGIFAHEQLPHLLQMIADAGNHLHRIGRVHLAATAHDDYPPEQEETT